MKSKGTKVANDEGWKKRSDDWVRMSHESRKRKEAENQERKQYGSRYKKLGDPTAQG